MQLRERHWRIFSLAGTLETVRGRGVAGQVRCGGGQEVTGECLPLVWEFYSGIR